MSDNKRYAKYKNNQTPAKWFKKLHNRKWKSLFKRQFKQWQQNPEFEIIEQSKKHSARWSW